jgi:hypothetical protein
LILRHWEYRKFPFSLGLDEKMLIIEQFRILRLPFILLERHWDQSMSEELEGVDGDMASDSNWWDYTVSCSGEIVGHELNVNRDRATYDASSSAYVTYSVASPLDAPASLTFGPKFMELASTYPGTVVMGEWASENS